MLLRPPIYTLRHFSSLLSKAEAVINILKHNYGHHTQHCSPNHNNDEIVMNI